MLTVGHSRCFHRVMHVFLRCVAFEAQPFDVRLDEIAVTLHVSRHLDDAFRAAEIVRLPAFLHDFASVNVLCEERVSFAA